jgi:hypothetical protein
MDSYLIAYIVIGACLILILLALLVVIILPFTKLYKDHVQKAVVKVTVVDGKPQKIEVQGHELEIDPGEKASVSIPKDRDFDPVSDVYKETRPQKDDKKEPAAEAPKA